MASDQKEFCRGKCKKEIESMIRIENGILYFRKNKLNGIKGSL